MNFAQIAIQSLSFSVCFPQNDEKVCALHLPKHGSANACVPAFVGMMG